jgi:putative ABC transport system substrate-binding protein
VSRIGFLMSNSPSVIAERVEAFGRKLRELGHVEGKTVTIEYRWAEGKTDRLPELAAELVRLNVDVIVTAGPTVTHAAKAASRTIPIVMAFDSDPVGSGFAVSLARPGGNITGLSTLAPEVSAKQLELLKEIVPTLSRVIVLGTLSQPGRAQAMQSVERAAVALGVTLQRANIEGARDLDAAFRQATRTRTDAVLALSSRVLVAQQVRVTQLAAKARLPVIYAERGLVQRGGLMSYGVSYADLYRRAAVYVDKILKGANPGELPIEQPTKFELVINERAAKELGLAIPRSVLLRADEVIQ